MAPAKPGLYRKYRVSRTDGRDAPGEKHDGCRYFILDLTHDPHAVAALRAYARSCLKDEPSLAADLSGLAMLMEATQEGWSSEREIQKRFDWSVSATHALVRNHPDEYPEYVASSVHRAMEETHESE